MITILTWVSIIAGGILVLLLLMSILGGLDLEADVDTETDAGGIGLLKGGLTFVSVASWVIKTFLATQSSPVVAIGIGIVCGVVALILLNYLFRLLLKNEANVNWKHEDALFQEGKVYLTIPKEGSGIIQVMIKGTLREMKARSNGEEVIHTGEQIYVTHIDNGEAIVRKAID